MFVASRRTEFRLNNDALNRASSIQMYAVNSHDGGNSAITEAGADHRGSCEHDIGVECSSKRSSSSFESPLVEQIN